MFEQTTNRAVEAALVLSANPALAGMMRRAPLPSGVQEALRVIAQPSVAEDRLERRDALEHWVQQIMLHPTSSPYRILGVEQGASRSEMRENFRLLMKWLHPDANESHWRSAFAPRVLDAWRQVSRGTADGDGRNASPAVAHARRRTNGRRPRAYPPRAAASLRRRSRRRGFWLVALCALVMLAGFGVYRYAAADLLFFSAGSAAFGRGGL